MAQGSPTAHFLPLTNVTQPSEDHSWYNFSGQKAIPPPKKSDI